MMRPSAPAARAARDMGSTSSALPQPWLGSTITGRWVSFLSTGTAEMSKVLRVAVSKVRIPRSHRMMLSLPPAMMYSALIRSSSMVLASPRFKRMGFLLRPRALSKSKFCILRAPTWRISTSAKRSSSAMFMISDTMGSPVSRLASSISSIPSAAIPWNA